jgi:hypothetical protein
MNKDYVTRNEFNTQIAKVERVEVIYDNSSNNININWGQTGGIYSGTTISGKDFSKYKKLRCLFGHSSTITVDLTMPFDGVYIANNVNKLKYKNALNLKWGEVQVNAEKTALTFYGGAQEGSSSDTYMWLYKIEGVY